MKRILSALLAALATATPAASQTTASPAPVAKADLSAAIGWTHLEFPEPGSLSSWHRDGTSGSLAFGWYWTDHHKTELTAGLVDEAEDYLPIPYFIDDRVHYGAVRTRRAARYVSAVQLYQFGRNSWVHPYVGGGLTIELTRHVRREEELWAVDPDTGVSRVVRPAIDHAPVRDVSIRPILAAGAKFYVQPRVFLLADFRLVPGRTVVRRVLQAGIGIDF